MRPKRKKSATYVRSVKYTRNSGKVIVIEAQTVAGKLGKRFFSTERPTTPKKLGRPSRHPYPTSPKTGVRLEGGVEGGGAGGEKKPRTFKFTLGRKAKAAKKEHRRKELERGLAWKSSKRRRNSFRSSAAQLGVNKGMDHIHRGDKGKVTGALGRGGEID